MTTTPALKTKLLSDRINRIEVSATMAVVAEAAKLREQGADLVDYGAGEPHFSTPQHIKDAAIAAINANFTRYTAVGGITELREAIVKRHAADFGSNYNPEECIASTGGKLALFNAIQVLVDHGDEVILPIPYWVSFKDIIQYAGGIPVYVETEESNGFQLTPRMIEQAITPRTKALILNSPSNPSGAVVKPADMRAIMQLCHERGVYVIADECYSYLDFSGAHISVGAYHETKEHAVIIGSLSKTYAMTGWRLGYALASGPIVKAMQKLQSQSTSNSTSMVQKAGVAALTGPQECIAEMRTDYIRLRDRVLEGLAEIPGVHCVKPGGAFYVYPNISSFFGRKGINSPADVARKLLHEAHMVTVPSEAFGTQEHIRISYATSRQELDKGLERMKKFFAAL
ncbi:MAG TPA: pyridoxal phosphate-dependent aminotransferase [Terriglobales bacterium]|jgi:aspartate aminotransferase|nr:pyridoxal phosphate-dependent aminotransferase [Terriglobales bacterium]